MSGAATLGAAYVQILPSAKGISGSLTNLLNPEAESAGKSSGAKAGAGIVSAIKTALITAGIGKAFQAVFNQGAQLQQNLGGTEAVFGEFSKAIQSDATEAYRNMGISASEYMATANKMGSLFQGSGLDQQKSLELTSTAMQRAADVASVMGIDTAMAMESIAGAAKGNFTMMDNLGVAMNATTLQAYALEKGINFKWNTASNAEKAELAMQMFMDRTSQYQGNFARESEETLSGSLGAMKAVFNDFLGNLALGNDIKPSLQALAKTAVTFLTKNFIPMIVNVVKALPGALVTIVKELAIQFIPIGSEVIDNMAGGMLNSLPNVFNTMTIGIENLKTFITTQMPTILAKGVEIVTNIANGILQSLPTIISSIGPLIGGIISTIYESIPIILQAGSDLIMNLIQGIIANGPAVLVSIYETMAQLLYSIASNLPAIYQKGIEIIGELIAGIIKSIPNLIGKIPGIVYQAASAFLSYDWLSVGINIISGIAQGLLNAAGKILDAILKVVGDAWNGVLDFFGIHSPARKGVYAGEMIDLGLAKGVLGKIGVVKSAMSELAELSTGTLESNLSVNAMANANKLSSIGNESNPLSSSGFNQTNNIYSPIPLSPYETARQLRNSTRQLVLSTNGKV